jgi:hypothetical protein
MHTTRFLAPLAAVAALAAAAGPATANSRQNQEPRVTVALGGELTREASKLGEREVQRQVDRLTEAVSRELARSNAYPGAEVRLVLTDLEPNRPTMQQTIDTPGLSQFHSRSIGGAAIEGELVTADGERVPLRFSRYSTSLADVRGHSTWFDADRAFDQFADRLADGRFRP